MTDFATQPPLLEIKDLVTEFRTESGTVRAVKGVSLVVHPGETVAVVGESGSGKSVTSLSVMRLLAKGVGSIAGGEVPMDEASLGPPFLTPPAQRFLDDDAAYKRLLSTPALSEIDLTQVLFVLFVGWIVVVCV